MSKGAPHLIVVVDIRRKINARMQLFHSNCTLPPEGTTYVSSPNVRGTLSIIWSCLSVLLFSTWSILYLNVPFNSTPTTDTQKHQRTFYRLLTKVNWMALNILAPEWPLAKAWSDYCSVSSLFKEFKLLAEEQDVPWTRTHVYLANMGGFGIMFDEMKTQRDLASNNAFLKDSPSAGPYQCPRTSESSIRHVSRDHGQQVQVLGANITEYSNNPASENENHALDLNTRPEDPSPRPEPVIDQTAEQDALPLEQGKVMVTALEQEERNILHSPLPASIQTSIRTARQRLSKDSISKSINKLSTKIGLIAWNLDDTNAAAVQKASHEVRLADFKNEAERHRFLVGSAVWSDNLHALQGNIWIVDAHQLLVIHQLGIIDTLPYLTSDELEGKSRADALVTLLSLGQVLWFTIQLIARLAPPHHPTTQLEIVTVAFSICSVITYILLWEKPKDIQTTMFIHAISYPTAPEISRIAVAGPWIFAQKRRSLWIPNNAIHWEAPAGNVAVKPMTQFNRGVAFSLIGFGSVHCLAWNFSFPTSVEHRVWQVASLLSIAVMPLAILVLVLFWKLAETKDGRSLRAKRYSTVIFLCFAVVFGVARGFVVVEAWRSLAYLPAGAFLNTWTKGWPHLG